MTLHQKIFSIIASIFIILIVFELVRRRKLREEYSWLWLLTSGIIIVLIVWYDLLVLITRLIGAVAPTTTLFIFGLLFLMIISLHYSVKISKLTYQIKEISQQMAILKNQVENRDEILK